MARTPLTVQQLTGPYPASLNLDDLVWTAADEINANSFALTGKEIILVRNDNVGVQTVTLTSIADPTSRTGNVTKAVSAGEYAVFQASDLTGWMQSDGLFYLQAVVNDVFFSIIRLK